MTFDEVFRYWLVGLTSAAIFAFALKVLGLRVAVLLGAIRELAECVGASVIFFSVNAGSASKVNTETSRGSYLLPPLSRFAEGIIRIGKQQVLTRLNWGEAIPTRRL